MNCNDAILVTGGAGFIGSNFVLDWLQEGSGPVINLDKLTYAGNPANLAAVRNDSRHIFQKGDIADRQLVRDLLAKHRPRAILNFAAESHVDRSIYGPEEFVRTNVNGTFCLLEEARAYFESLPAEGKGRFRFLHVSTDEVFGSLSTNDPPFTESSRYAPNSPYAASKAASDHLVRAYHHTYGLPTLTTNCSNNYGPYQFPEKLIPLVIYNAVEGKPIPIYGDGSNIRDWLYVGDHCSAIRIALERGRVGRTYNIGGNSEKTNLQVVQTICSILDEARPRSQVGHQRSPITRYSALITFVKDRPGHDRRYAMDSSTMKRELGWEPAHNFENGIRETVTWYLEHRGWVEEVISGEYRTWVDRNYGNR